MIIMIEKGKSRVHISLHPSHIISKDLHPISIFATFMINREILTHSDEKDGETGR